MIIISCWCMQTFGVISYLVFSCVGFNEWDRFSAALWVLKQQTCWWQRSQGVNRGESVSVSRFRPDSLIMNAGSLAERTSCRFEINCWAGIACSTRPYRLQKSVWRWPDLWKTTVRVSKLWFRTDVRCVQPQRSLCAGLCDLDLPAREDIVLGS